MCCFGAKSRSFAFSSPARVVLASTPVAIAEIAMNFRLGFAYTPATRDGEEHENPKQVQAQLPSGIWLHECLPVIPSIPRS